MRLLPRPVICELNYCTFSCLAVAAPPPPLYLWPAGNAPSPARLFFVVVTLLFIQRHGPPIDRGAEAEAVAGNRCGVSA